MGTQPSTPPSSYVQWRNSSFILLPTFVAEVSYNGLEEAWSNEILPPNDEMQQLPDADSQEGGLKHAQQKQYLLMFFF